MKFVNNTDETIEFSVAGQVFEIESEDDLGVTELPIKFQLAKFIVGNQIELDAVFDSEEEKAELAAFDLVLDSTIAEEITDPEDPENPEDPEDPEDPTNPE